MKKVEKAGRFIPMDGATVILVRRGTYREVPVFQMGGELYALYGRDRGYIKLFNSGTTSVGEVLHKGLQGISEHAFRHIKVGPILVHT